MFIIRGRNRCLGSGGFRWLIGRGIGFMRRIGRRVCIRRGGGRGWGKGCRGGGVLDGRGKGGDGDWVVKDGVRVTLL